MIAPTTGEATYNSPIVRQSEASSLVKLHYYPETDSLYIEFAERPSSDSREVAPGVVLDFDASGGIVGIDVDHDSPVLVWLTCRAWKP